MHGITVNELTTGTRPINDVSTAIIGLVGTAPDAVTDTKAKLLTGDVGTNNALTFTSKLAGVAGNAITVALVHPQANDAALAVVVAGKAITVNLATSAGGAITTTATQLAAAIAANADANALVAAANTGASTGAGLVAALAAAPLAGGLDAAFTLGQRTLVTDVRGAVAKAGSTGTLPSALAAIADICNPIVVVVAVDVDDEGQDDLVTAGLQLLIGAEAQLGVRPRIIGAPGLDTLAVTTEMASVARRLRGMAYAMAIGATVPEATDYAEGFGARELMLFWPGFAAGGADTVARALGMRAWIDQTVGWHKTLSNVVVPGVTGLAQDIFFDITGDGNNDVNLLNAGNITTMIRIDGFRFWGDRTCSDEPLFTFESAVRTAQVLQDEMAAGLLWAIDKPLTKVLCRDIVDTINAKFRQLISQGRLIGANASIDWNVNPADQLAAGKLVIDYDFTPCAPLEGLMLNQRITDRYYASLADTAS